MSVAGAADSESLAELRMDFDALQFSHTQLTGTVELLTTQNALLAGQLTRQAEILQQLLRVLSAHNIRFDDVPLGSFPAAGADDGAGVAAAAAADAVAAVANGGSGSGSSNGGFPHLDTLDLAFSGMEVYEVDGSSRPVGYPSVAMLMAGMHTAPAADVAAASPTPPGASSPASAFGWG
jgi:hypothetical protein